MTDNKPNVLILFTDMQRADTIHALGNKTIKTPNLDRLVSEGTSFANCFSPSPVCIPARCCMHYGLYPQKTGLAYNGTMMDDNKKSYPAVLGDHGYRTHAIGKCHFTPDVLEMRGFQSRQTQEECTSDAKSDDYIAWLQDNGYDDFEPHGARGDMYYIPQISTLPAEAHPSQWIGNESVRFIQKLNESEQPWCLFSSFIHPHPPFAPPKPWHKLYAATDMPLPLVSDNNEKMYTWINRLQNRYKHRDRGIDLNLIRMMKAYYYASISFVDYQIGRILDALKQTGKLDDTIIMFASDHGEYLGDYNCFGKRSMHDASARVPLLVRYPKNFSAGELCSTAVSLCDLFPTLLTACNISEDEIELDGIDLSEIAKGENGNRVVYSQFEHGDSAIYMAVNKDWKYVYSAADDKELLFNRNNDLHELNNLANSEAVTTEKQTIKENLLNYLSSVNATDAYTMQNDTLEWRKYHHYDEEYLKNPDEKLLIQHYYKEPLNITGYTE